MPHENTLDARRAALVVVDMQESFRAVVPDFAEVAARIATAVRGAQLLGVPVVVTEQYPRGLGRTAAEIAAAAALAPPAEAIEKTAFSSCGAAEFVARLEGHGAKQILVCGIEAHICVNQTTHDLLGRGYQVHLLADCVTARNARNRETGLAKMLASGALPCSVEMALFEMLRDARHEHFKAVQSLIK